MIDIRIKMLRESKSLTQANLAKRLGISRSSVNAWEMGISTPSTQYIVQLAHLFGVSADYLLGVDSTTALNTTGLTNDDITVIHYLIQYLSKKSENR